MLIYIKKIYDSQYFVSLMHNFGCMIYSSNNDSGKNCIECFNAKEMEATLSLAQLEEMKQNSVTVNFKKGEIIRKQGIYAANIAFLEKGLAKVYLEFNAKNLILRVEPAGQFLGLQCLCGNINRYTCVAYEDSTVNLIDINYFRKLMNENAPFTYHITNAINEASIAAFSRIICLTQKKSHGRVAEIIICLSERIYKSTEFKLHFPRKDLAELTNMSVENLTRTLNDFKNDSIIDIKGNDFKIVNFEMLKKVSQKG